MLSFYYVYTIFLNFCYVYNNNNSDEINAHNWLANSPVVKQPLVTKSNESAQNVVVINKSVKPPLIVVQNIERIGVLHDSLSKLSVQKYELKVLRDNEVKIFAESSIHYEMIVIF